MHVYKSVSVTHIMSANHCPCLDSAAYTDSTHAGLAQRAQGAHRVYDIIGALPLLLVGYLRAYHTLTRWVVCGPFPTWTSSSLVLTCIRLLVHPLPDRFCISLLIRRDTIAMAQPG